MGQRHWLDPLARRLLIASGQLRHEPVPSKASTGWIPWPAGLAAEAATPDVERDLLELKLRQQPGRRLHNADEVRHAADLGWRLDVNRATAQDWLRLPGISADQVDLLMRLQAGGVQLSGPEDLERLLGLPGEHVRSWLPLLEFRWYGEPPPAPPAALLDLNQASLPQLAELGLSSERSRRLLRERARQPFQDLADLQQRLQLPAALIEGWIGRVCCKPGLPGPALPLPPR